MRSQVRVLSSLPLNYTMKKCGIIDSQILTPHDPVRPNIPDWWRVRDGFTEMYKLGDPWDACVCLAFCEDIPRSEFRLLTSPKPGSTAVFYTVWSRRKGAGREIILEGLSLLKSRATRFVTLSPKTEQAMRFHLSNGAVLLRENLTTYNFEYGVPC